MFWLNNTGYGLLAISTTFTALHEGEKSTLSKGEV